MDTRHGGWTQKLFDATCDWLLPLGLVILLIGLAVLPERSLYHKLFYLTIAIPALLALILHPKVSVALWRNPIVVTFLMFSAWALLSISWSDTDRSFTSLLKRPIYILMLFSACFLIAFQRQQRLPLSTVLAALLMLPITIYSLIIFTTDSPPGSRLIGTGALDNPLLSSHLYGFFCALWLALSMALPVRRSWPALIAMTIMGAAIIATGSRTPLLAITMTCGWLIMACWDRRAIWLALCGATSLLVLIIFYPEVISSRGLSYRPELWLKTLINVSEQPWTGHGFDNSLTIFLSEKANQGFSEPHNFTLGVLYYTGIPGLTLWLAMHAIALFQCWKHRKKMEFIVFGALLVYGIGAGLTEGGGILPRPKEQWLLTWIPLALIAALSARAQKKQEIQS